MHVVGFDSKGQKIERVKSNTRPMRHRATVRLPSARPPLRPVRARAGDKEAGGG
jgi:hypothetical protein